ncbi:hypothetical protein [Halobellus rufus]|uniref:hypothetical protein n=1 Tax=Halobellus rufus TaxID=1448860 RepID=UPI0009DFEAE0|nr:hypothetical protein [Halobellus rufus]
MPWECHAGVADDCVIEDLFDPPYYDADGMPLCLPCAVEIGMHDPVTDRPKWAAEDPRPSLSFQDLRQLKRNRGP